MVINLDKHIIKLRNTKYYSQYNHFDYELTLESPSSSPLVMDILYLIEKSSSKDRDHLAVILANLIRDLGEGGVYSAFPMEETKIPACVNGFGLRRNRIKTLMLDMRDHGLVDFHIGSRDKDANRHLMTKVRASEKLAKMILQHHPEGIYLVRPANRECIRQKSKAPDSQTKGKLIEFRDTERVKRMRSRLIRYNRLLEQSQITLNTATADRNVIRQTDFSQCFTYRVFNDGKWDRGGRFYGGWWVNFPSEQRQHILINGEATVEVDFCNQALVLLYAMEGIHYGSLGRDGYSVLDKEGKPYPRHVVKSLFTMALNCPSDNQTIQAFMKERREVERIAKEARHPFSSFPRMGKHDLLSLLDDFRNDHPHIQHHICQGKSVGLRLQYLDSLIADEVIRQMTWHRIPTLCIHDSFICAIQHEDTLLRVVADAYARVIGERLRFCSEGILRLERNCQGINSKLSVEIGQAA